MSENFWIWVRIQDRQFFKFGNPTPVQTPATIIDPTVIYPCVYLRNDYTDSCYCRNWKVTPGPVSHKLLTPVPKEKRRILPESTPHRYHLWNPMPLICIYELRHSLHLSLLKKWPVFLQNASGNLVLDLLIFLAYTSDTKFTTNKIYHINKMYGRFVIWTS